MKYLRHQMWLALVVGCLAVNVGCQKSSEQEGTAADADKPPAANSRHFELVYSATITGVKDNSNVRVWFPVSESNEQQKVDLVKSMVPTKLELNRDKKYENQIGFFETTKSDAKDVTFSVTYDIARNEAMRDDSATLLTDAEKQLFLSANSMVPIEGRPLELLKDKTLPDEAMAASESLYDVVEQHMKYDKSQPGYGNGDSVWACDSKTGNCTDFHSLFISLARSRKIPARFEIGFPIPSDQTEGKIGGYHCWAWFHVEGEGWSPVDISEADKHPEMKEYYFGRLTADRVSFSTGRDIELVPASKAGPRNYFVYPHVEVDGVEWPKDKIQLNFSFRNLD